VVKVLIIDMAVNERHESQKAGKAGRRVGGFKKRTAAEDMAFERVFTGLLMNINN
jgi:hypothetical protein